MNRSPSTFDCQVAAAEEHIGGPRTQGLSAQVRTVKQRRDNPPVEGLRVKGPANTRSDIKTSSTLCATGVTALRSSTSCVPAVSLRSRAMLTGRQGAHRAGVTGPRVHLSERQLAFYGSIE